MPGRNSLQCLFNSVSICTTAQRSLSLPTGAASPRRSGQTPRRPSRPDGIPTMPTRIPPWSGTLPKMPSPSPRETAVNLNQKRIHQTKHRPDASGTGLCERGCAATTGRRRANPTPPPPTRLPLSNIRRGEGRGLSPKNAKRPLRKGGRDSHATERCSRTHATQPTSALIFFVAGNVFVSTKSKRLRLPQMLVPLRDCYSQMLSRLERRPCFRPVAQQHRRIPSLPQTHPLRPRETALLRAQAC